MFGPYNKFDQQLLSQCGSTYSCQRRLVAEIHKNIAGMVNSQPITNLWLRFTGFRQVMEKWKRLRISNEIFAVCERSWNSHFVLKVQERLLSKVKLYLDCKVRVYVLFTE